MAVHSSRGDQTSRTPFSEEPLIAVFVDFENLAIGVRDMKAGKFQIQLVLKRLLEKGRIVYKRAYCDWANYQDSVREFHGQGIELIDIPQSKMSGKNSADIRMVVDALDLCYSKQHIDVFALISGDSDFSPLVSKLKENNKRVLGCGVKSSTSDLLIANCDEFMYYDDLIRVAKRSQSKAAPRREGTPSSKSDKKQEASDRVLEVVHSIEQDYDPLWGSLLKQAIRRVFPGFNEGYYGYGSFSELLEDIKDKGLIVLEYDESRGNYKVRLPKETEKQNGKEKDKEKAAPAAAAPKKSRQPAPDAFSISRRSGILPLFGMRQDAASTGMHSLSPPRPAHYTQEQEESRHYLIRPHPLGARHVPPIQSASGRLLVLLLMGISLPMSGCGGCGKSDAGKQQAEAKKKKEKPKPDFDVSVLRVEPADPEKPLSEAKPGHWLSVSRTMTANNFDFVGDLEADVATNVDNRMTPLELERQPFVLATTRNVVLPKGQTKYIDQTLFIPRCEHDPWIRDRLSGRGGIPVVDPQAEKLTRMPAYQYYFLVFAREPSRYKSFGRMDALLGPSSNGLPSYYLFNTPRVDKYIPLPSNSLAWTSTAYVLWDDVDPSLLSTQQQQAMLDWLEWGGQLIVSGPDTLTLLRGSFLDPHLPAVAGKSRSLTAESLAPLRPTNGDQKIPPLKPMRPWSGVALEVRPSADWLPDERSDLIAEAAVGRGRIVVTAFHLSQRELIDWEGFDSLLNSCLLRHPPRRYVDSNDLERSSVPQWADKDKHPFDARLTCGLRYLTRDIDADGTIASGSDPAATAFRSDDGYDSSGPVDGTSTGSGVAGWNDFSGISSAARESLRAAAGITIPRSSFIAWMLAGYLAVLGPLNWGIFRLLGRVEWAWVAAPVIAILGAVVVTKAAHLNIGFARSQTEIDVVELQPNYSRAHLTRYTALYTSLSTSYDVRFDDPHALVAPFALGGETRSRPAARTVTLHRDADVRLTDFDVSSNSTAMLHSEQMFDLGGGISCVSEGGRLRIYNHTKYTLEQSGVVWCDADGELISASIGELPPESSRPLDFQPIAEGEPLLPQLLESPGGAPADDVARLKIDAIADVVENPKGFKDGEMRLIGVLAEPLPGMQVTPASSQATRAVVFVVANLRYAPLLSPQADVNLRPPKNAPAEPVEPPSGGN